MSRSFELPVRIGRMLEIPKRSTALYGGNDGEVICRRRRRRRPLERPGVPWVAARSSSLDVRPQQIDDKNPDSERLEEHANRHNKIPHIPTTAGLIGVDSSRHAQESGDVHEVKRQVESNQEEPEMKLTQSFAVHLPRHLRKPVVEGTEDREHDRTYDHVVKVRDHEVGGTELPIERRSTQHDSRETSDQELEEKGNTEQHRCLELNPPSPHRGQPVEDLNSGGDR